MEEKVEENILDPKAKEKIALIEITPYQAKLVVVWKTIDSFDVFDEFCESLDLHEDIERDGFIQPTQAVQCREVLKMFRKFCDNQKITKSVAYATCDLRAAKNHFAFLEEMEMASGFKFKFLTEDEEVQMLQTMCINTIDASKGILFEIEQEQTKIVAYSRKSVVGKQIIPFGYENLAKLFIQANNYQEQSKIIQEFFANQIENVDWFMMEEPSDIKFIGAGEIFETIAKISRKGKKYNLDMSHGYVMDQKDFENVLNAVLPLKLDKEARLKGFSKKSLAAIVCGLSVAKALFGAFVVQNFTISTAKLSDGVLFKNCLPVAAERPIQDLLGFCLESNQTFHQPYQTNGRHVFDLSMLLFRQLRVMHKLSSRLYVKALKIASYMHNCGAMMRFSETQKDALSVILHTKIYGASHRDIILAAFIAQCQYLEDFSLNEWVKYKDLVTDEDLVAVKYLAVMVRLASCFDISSNNAVTDVICDVLGDSVIVKTVTNQDISFEVNLASQAAGEFKQVYGKTLELL